jgi:alpha-tubulin suppressor-like RCC1 family protein
VFAILADGTIAGWGANRCGELGDGTKDDSTTAVRVQNLDHVIGVSSGACHACALTSDGGVQCWGDNNYGVLGSGEDNSFESLTPLQVKW